MRIRCCVSGGSSAFSCSPHYPCPSSFAHFRHQTFLLCCHSSYRTVRFSAKLRLAIACHPSVRLSVTLVDCDHVGWKSWKLIARTISPAPSLFVAKRRSTYSQGNMGKFGETRVGVKKSDMLANKSGNISETHKDRGKVTMDGL